MSDTENTFIDESFFTGETEKKQENDAISSLQNNFSQKQIGSIAKYVEPVSGNSPIENLIDMFKQQEDLAAVPVEEYDHVVGVIDRKTAAAATNTAWKRFTSKNIIDYTQRVSTILYAHDFIEKTLQKVSAINREYGIIYFPVFNNRSFYGIVSLDSFLSRIAEIREQDLEKASLIQRNYFPDESVTAALPYKFQAWNKMANALGGDFYQLHTISDSKSLIGCFDVSGKNVAASLLTIALGSFFKTLPLLAKKEENPSLIISQLDDYLQQSVPSGNFITAVMCFVDLSSSKLYIYNCGHTVTYLLYKDAPSSQEGKLASIKPELPPLGMGAVKSALENASKQPFTVVPLKRGMHLDLYTDGFTDMKNDDGLRYEDELAKKFFIKLYGIKDEDVCSTIEHTVNAWIQNAMIPDDITVIDVRL
jgi:sigma-B regulation protein RsbU (phosphoserine phosphatase)